jgi:hypothetical protein
MVLSNAPKRVTHRGAYTNQNQGGGDAKAGLISLKNVGQTRFIAVGTCGPPVGGRYALGSQSVRTTNTQNPAQANSLIYPLRTTVRQSRPVGSRPEFNNRWNMVMVGAGSSRNSG